MSKSSSFDEYPKSFVQVFNPEIIRTPNGYRNVGRDPAYLHMWKAVIRKKIGGGIGIKRIGLFKDVRVAAMAVLVAVRYPSMVGSNEIEEWFDDVLKNKAKWRTHFAKVLFKEKVAGTSATKTLAILERGLGFSEKRRNIQEEIMYRPGAPGYHRAKESFEKNMRKNIPSLKRKRSPRKNKPSKKRKHVNSS